jgi:hypothetical protein
VTSVTGGPWGHMLYFSLTAYSDRANLLSLKGLHREPIIMCPSVRVLASKKQLRSCNV